MSEILSAPEQALPTKTTIDQFETKLLEAGSPIATAEAKFDALNFKSDAIDHVRANAELRDTKAEFQPQVDALSTEWSDHGGARLDAARVAVDALNFKSDALDHVAAKKELQAAEDAWAESYDAARSQPAELKEVSATAPVASGEKTSDDSVVETDLKPAPEPERTPASIQERINDHVGLVELQAKAVKLAELRASVGEDSADFKQALQNWEQEVNGARKWYTVSAEDDAIFDHLRGMVGASPEAVPSAAIDVQPAAHTDILDTSDLDTNMPALDGESLEEYEARNAGTAESPVDANTAGTLDTSDIGETTASKDEKLDTSGLDVDLDVEKASIWKKVGAWAERRRAQLYTSVGMANLRLGNTLAAPERINDESNEDYEKRAKKHGRRVVLGSLAVVTAVVGGLYLAKYGFDHIGVGQDATPDLAGATPGHISTPESADLVTPPVDAATPALELSPEALMVEPGEGFYQTFKEMNIPSSEWPSLLDKVGPALNKLGLAYPMGESSWGISKPGPVQAMVELIQKNR